MALNLSLNLSHDIKCFRIQSQITAAGPFSEDRYLRLARLEELKLETVEAPEFLRTPMCSCYEPQKWWQALVYTAKKSKSTPEVALEQIEDRLRESRYQKELNIKNERKKKVIFLCAMLEGCSRKDMKGFVTQTFSEGIYESVLEMSERMGVSPSTSSRWCCGK